MAYSVTDLEIDSVGVRSTRHGTLLFTGNYPDEGEPMIAADFGLGVIHDLIPHGMATAADGETAVSCSFDRTNKKLIFYESAATGLAGLEKTASEAYPTNLGLRVSVRGN